MHKVCKCGMYAESTDSRARTLSDAGCSANVDRCYSTATGKLYAVKKLLPSFLSKYGQVVANEVNALRLANATGIPGVVQLLAQFQSPADETCLVMELVRGCEVRSWHEMCVPPLSIPGNERRMQEVAVQLLETVNGLHHECKLAHLDVTSNNIMLRSDASDKWDQLCLLDPGFAQKCVTEDKMPQSMRICPEGCTYQYASPQHLRSLQLQLENDWPDTSLDGSSADLATEHSQCAAQHRQSPLQHSQYTSQDTNNAHSQSKYSKLIQGLRFRWRRAAFCGCCPSGSSDMYAAVLGEVDVLIDGWAADMWSVGVVLYEMLTGELPFQPTEEDEIVAPDRVPHRHQSQWRQYEAIQRLYTHYAEEASKYYKDYGVFGMEHPVLDRVRQCSAHPERAAAFFGKLLWPWERSRSNAGDALQEFYLQDTRQEMRRDRQQAGKESGTGHDSTDKKQCLTAVQQRVPSFTASEPSPAEDDQQFDSHVGQVQRSCANSADPAVLCPLAVERCPAMHVQFQPELNIQKPPQSAALQSHTCDFHHWSAPPQHHADTVTALPSGVEGKVAFPPAQQQKKAAWPLSSVQPSSAVLQVQASAPELHDKISVGQPQLDAVAQSAELQRHGLGESAGQAQPSGAARGADLQRHDLANAAVCSLPTGRVDDPAPPNAAPDSSSRTEAKQPKRLGRAFGKACKKVKAAGKSCAKGLRSMLEGSVCCRLPATRA